MTNITPPSISRVLDEIENSEVMITTKEIQETMIVDEMLCYHGQMISSYGHTEDLLIYWDKKGRSWIAQRDKTRHFLNMHDELFSATYERNDIYDLSTSVIIENYKNNAHSN